MPETFDRARLRAELERDEGRRRRPYRDSEGIWTVGVGFNLEANDLPDDVIDRLLEYKIEHAIETLDAIEPRWRSLPGALQLVLLNLSFQLGTLRFLRFRRFWEAIREFLDLGTKAALDRAADELLDSKMARQTPNRVARHVDVLRTFQI